MSKIETVEIECPECREIQATTVWHSLNTSLDAEDKELLFAGKINNFHCQNCSNEASIPIDFLYHDMVNRYLVQFYHPRNLDNEDFFKILTPEGYLNMSTPAPKLVERAEQMNGGNYLSRQHIVFSMEELIRYVMFRDKLAAMKSEIAHTPIV